MSSRSLSLSQMAFFVKAQWYTVDKDSSCPVLHGVLRNRTKTEDRKTLCWVFVVSSLSSQSAVLSSVLWKADFCSLPAPVNSCWVWSVGRDQKASRQGMYPPSLLPAGLQLMVVALLCQWGYGSQWAPVTTLYLESSGPSVVMTTASSWGNQVLHCPILAPFLSAHA